MALLVASPYPPDSIFCSSFVSRIFPLLSFQDYESRIVFEMIFSPLYPAGERDPTTFLHAFQHRLDVLVAYVVAGLGVHEDERVPSHLTGGYDGILSPV